LGLIDPILGGEWGANLTPIYRIINYKILIRSGDVALMSDYVIFHIFSKFL